MDELESRTWRRVKAGFLMEMGLVPRAVVSRWQKAFLSGSFNADLCSEEALSSPVEAGVSERLCDRAGLLLRDFLMGPRAAGTGARGPRAAARRRSTPGIGVMLLSQFAALIVFTILVLVGMLLARHMWSFSFDNFFDSALRLVRR
jgi:hypothetical protein